MISATVNLIISVILLISIGVLYMLVLTRKDNNPTFDTISVKNIKLGDGLGITTGKGQEIQFYGKRNNKDQVAVLMKIEGNTDDWGTIMTGSKRGGQFNAPALQNGCNVGGFC